MGVHGGQNNMAEAFVALCPVEERYGLPEAVNRPLIIAPGVVGLTEARVCERLLDDFPLSRGKHEETLGNVAWAPDCRHVAVSFATGVVYVLRLEAP